VARVVLLTGTAVWGLAGLAGLAIAGAGTDALTALLPPLSIDRDALARTIVALAIACLALGLAHAVAARGLRRNNDWARTAGTLLAGLLCAVFVAGAAAAITSGAAGTMHSLAATGTGAAALLLAAGYGAAALDLVGQVRAGGRG
jgi:hypothetical protein